MGKITFTPAHQITDPLSVSVGLSGGSGTGKTYTAGLLARGLAEGITGKAGAPFGYVDTENRRALHYRSDFPEMMHFDFSAIDPDTGEMLGFGPERWIEVIDAAEEADLPVLILDSFSHAWEGVGGVLDLHAQVLDEMVAAAEKRANGRYEVDPQKYSQLAWAQVKPRYRRLIDRIVRAKCQIVVCTRAKPVMQAFDKKLRKEVNARKTKTRRADIPWDPAADGDLMFEMTAMVILDPSAPGCPVHQVKVADQFKALFDPARPMGVATGRAMAEWAKNQDSAAESKRILDAAREAARGGREAFAAHWKGLSRTDQALVRTITDECKALAEAADRAAAQADADPFDDDQQTEAA